MEINEQIKNAESLLKYTQDYLAVKKLLKTIKTNFADVNLQKLADCLSVEIKKHMEVL